MSELETTDATLKRGEPVYVRVGAWQRRHASFMRQGDVTQCMDCGRWTRLHPDRLEDVECVEWPDDTPLDDLEVR